MQQVVVRTTHVFRLQVRDHIYQRSPALNTSCEWETGTTHEGLGFLPNVPILPTPNVQDILHREVLSTGYIPQNKAVKSPLYNPILLHMHTRSLIIKSDSVVDFSNIQNSGSNPPPSVARKEVIPLLIRIKAR